MKKFIIVAIILIALYACGSSSPSQDQTTNSTNQSSEPTTDNAVPKSGAEIYSDKCVLCHGDDGKKGLMGAVDLTTSSATHDIVVTTIKNGKNQMTAFGGQLTADEIEAVAKYAEGLRK
jgi:cytochrome c6